MPLLTITKRNYTHSIRNLTVLIVFVAVVAGIYGFSQFQKYSLAQTALAMETDLLQKTQQDTNELTTKYLEIKKSFDAKFAKVLDALQYVMPADETYKNVVRLLDQFAQDNNLPNSPFFISDEKFGISHPDPKKDFSVLPFSMTISASRDNFLKFLKFVESSGMLENKTRVLEIRSISINFVNTNSGSGSGSIGSGGSLTGGGSSQLLNVSVAMNAYFEKPKITPTKTPTKK